ncbi:MAG: hypothetical protein DRP14_04270 [Candidatus Aenigmatarchaeota archaeon]|nr:MAG: hypothetical protein DRP14_04270 [Candidatus Aenigmarchaeota archaeon]
MDFTIMRLVGWCPDLWGSASAAVIGHETKKDIPMLLKCSIFKLLPQLIEKSTRRKSSKKAAHF